MARRPRIVYPGAVYHVCSRGNRKGAIFEDDRDRQTFIDLLRAVHERYAVRLYGYCLMGNHYHLVVETPRGNLSAAMRQLNGQFATATNARHNRTGHLFGGRYASVVIEQDRYLRRAIRYVARNPLKAGYVKHPREWPWSSYRATAGLEPQPTWLELGWLSWAFEVETLEDAQRRFVEYVDRVQEQKAVNLRSVAYGSPEFEAALIEVARRRRAERPLPRAATSQEPPPPLSEIFASVGSLIHRDRLIQVAHRKHGYALADISRHLNLHRSAAARILKRVESSAATIRPTRSSLSAPRRRSAHGAKPGTQH